MAFIFSFSDRTKTTWKKYFGRKFVVVQLAIIWILPTLIWIAAWVEKNVEYDTGSGNEDGRVCYAEERGKRVFITSRQTFLLLSVEISVMIIILLSCGILFYHFEKEAYEERERHKTHQIRLLHFNIIAAHKKRSMNTSMGIICASYIILRLPWIIISNTHREVGEQFSYEYAICGMLAIVRYCVMAFLLGFTNKNFRRAYFFRK